MRIKNSLYGCAAVLALGFATGSYAQTSALSQAERAQLLDLLQRFQPDQARNLNNIPATQQRLMLNQLASYLALAPEFERLVVCEVSGDPHLLKDDVIYLIRLGSSGTMMMEVVRNEGMPNEMHPWKSAGGGSDSIVINPSITGKPHMNPAFKKFSPEAVGTARVNPHTGGTPQDHSFAMRRNTRVNVSADCDAAPGDEDLFIFNTTTHGGPAGRHDGHAVAD